MHLATNQAAYNVVFWHAFNANVWLPQEERDEAVTAGDYSRDYNKEGINTPMPFDSKVNTVMPPVSK